MVRGPGVVGGRIGSVLIADTLSFLIGNWDIRRSITDHLSATDGSFAGRATLVVQGDGRGPGRPDEALYRESGNASFGTHTGPATRELRYVRRGESAVMLYFSDGRPFVDLDLTRGEWRSLHPCGEDRYETVTIVRSENTVEERWRVRGPAKDYEAVTFLTRLPPVP